MMGDLLCVGKSDSCSLFAATLDTRSKVIFTSTSSYDRLTGTCR
jgi:hypothetical protein